jgi:hypothetical protein
VGFLSMVDAVRQKEMPHLEMMGGEFCVNVMRSAAVVFASKGALPRTGEGKWQGEISASGTEAPVRVMVREIYPEIAYESALALPPPIAKRHPPLVRR